MSRNILFIMIHIFIVNKIRTNHNVNCRNESNTMCGMQELHLFIFLCIFSMELHSANITSVRSSTNLSINFFLHLQFS